ncbi:unnamed protein product [Urochloa decumbens]|uniref:Uncharacterized protein n=1 Tax=Urochloa decumbens TaxID=240449 RepID=A0ABC9GDL3_9POAL
MMYQLRVAAVKRYYRNKDQPIDHKLACTIELEFDQYMEGQIKWCNDEVWPELCAYWCSQDYKDKRKIGQDCRLGSDDTAQNHGGSRPFIETQQVLEAKFGPEKATPLNVYAVMKSGMKSVDSTGTSGAIKSRKAQKRMDDYIAGTTVGAHPEEDVEHEGMEVEEGEGEGEGEQEQNLNARVLYDVSSGPRSHGRLAIANGAVKVAAIRAAAKAKRVKPSNPVSLQSMAREMARLRCVNAKLQQDNHDKDNALREYKVVSELTLGLYRELGKEVPENALQRLSAAQAIPTGSSHVGSESTNNSIDVDGNEGDEVGATHIHSNTAASNHQIRNNSSM